MVGEKVMRRRVPAEERVGEDFDRLRVESVERRKCGPSQNRRTFMHCVCECGTRCVVELGNLLARRTRSCGCLMWENLRDNLHTHGQSRMDIRHEGYNTWAGIIQRCTNPKSKAFKDYGGRGITVCEMWRCSFEAFMDDMGPKPSPSMTIERKDNSLGYEPGNCVWATRVEQARNTRRNRWIEFQGERFILKEWAAKFGYSESGLKRLLNRWGDEEGMRRAAGGPRHRRGGAKCVASLRLS